MNKILAVIAALSLTATVVIGGSVAYLTSETETTVNQMTIGNVEIEQLEHQRDKKEDGFSDGNLVDFVNKSQMMPDAMVQGDSRKFENWDRVTTGKDKYVRVQNTGKNPCYVRTIFAFEKINGEDMLYKHFAEIEPYKLYGKNPIIDESGDMIIGGKEYALYIYTYPYELPVGSEGNPSITAPSLIEVALAGDTTAEDLADIGETIDIYVASQAVQSEGFDEFFAEEGITDPLQKAKRALDMAFGGIYPLNTPFAQGTWVHNDEELAAFLNAAEGSGVAIESYEDPDKVAVYSLDTGNNSNVVNKPVDIFGDAPYTDQGRIYKTELQINRDISFGEHGLKIHDVHLVNEGGSCLTAGEIRIFNSKLSGKQNFNAAHVFFGDIEIAEGLTITATADTNFHIDGNYEASEIRALFTDPENCGDIFLNGTNINLSP